MEEATHTETKEFVDITGLTGVQKAAIFVMSLGAKQAGEMMKSLSEKEIELITMEISRMKDVKPEYVDAILQDYYIKMDNFDKVLNGGLDYAHELIEHLGGSERMKKKIKAHAGSNVFAEFQESKITQIAHFIQGEHPQVAALIFSQLHVDKSAEILGYLSAELQTEIVYRLARMDKISADVIEEIEEVIKEHLGGMDTMGDRVKSGTNIVAQILNGADITVERHVLDDISEMDPQTATDIKEQMFLFEDIIDFDNRTIQIIINELEKADMVMGLKGVDELLASRFLSNMSERAADMLREDMDSLGPVPLKDVKEAQQRIIKKIKALEEDGQISTRKMDEEEVVE